MKKVQSLLEKIADHREEIAKGKLFQWLSDESIDGYHRLSFTPNCLSYLMGFKDVLSLLRRPNPENELETAINAYCAEDGEHWPWYLKDMEKLGFNIQTWGNNLVKWCHEAWSPETEINRQTIFHLMYHAQSCRHPIYSLSMIWVFEATGVIFIGNSRKAAISLGMDETLLYFGRTHYEEEFSHSVVAQDYADIEIEDSLHDQICEMIDQLFNDYTKMFTCWYELRNKYSLSKVLQLAN
ncbi:MAG TPA: hypothetical protein VK184_05250 [Nostocaceae cyanobacterium]|nr:hypothetical protein [Nostocaceae cyanobacterium]